MQEYINQLPNTAWGFTIFFVAVWCITCFVIGIISGWFSLSRRFGKSSGPLGETRNAGPWSYTIYMRFWGHYSGVVRLTAAQDSLYPSVLFLFRVGHPPLRIPWNEIGVGRTRRFFRNYVVLTLGNEERIPMRISERMAGKLGLFERFPALAPASASR